QLSSHHPHYILRQFSSHHPHYILRQLSSIYTTFSDSSPPPPSTLHSLTALPHHPHYIL
ncbi:unnamed protein product, partial [Staurois parvus]